MSTPKPYEPPTATVVGDVKSLTAGKPTLASKTDKSYPAGTAKSDMKFY